MRGLVSKSASALAIYQPTFQSSQVRSCEDLRGDNWPGKRFRVGTIGVGPGGLIWEPEHRAGISTLVELVKTQRYPDAVNLGPGLRLLYLLANDCFRAGNT